MTESVRHHARTVVNVLGLIAAVLALPELGEIIPATALPVIAGAAAVLNVILSLLRGKL